MKALLALFLIATPAFADSQSVYDSIATGARQVSYLSERGEPMVGVNISEKLSPNGVLCQKSEPVVPNPVATYTCLRESLTGARAKAVYEALDREVAVAFSVGGAPMVGSQTYEKDTTTGFCRRTAPVVPRPKFTYTCYELFTD